MAYGTDQGFQDWLAAYGYTLPVGALSPAILRARGSTYLDATYEIMWTGNRTDPLNQENAWPRTGAVINCSFPIPDDVIPQAVINAAYRAAYIEATSAGSLTPSGSGGGRVKREKVDVIETEYFDDGIITPGTGGSPSFIDAEIDGMMAQFICDGIDGNGAFIYCVNP